MYWRPQTSGYSYQTVAAIRIDVHPAGEIQPTCHKHPTLSPHMVPDHTYLTWSTHINLSRSHQQIWTNPLLWRRRDPDLTHSTPADRSTGPYPASLPEQPKKQWKSQASVDSRLLCLLGPYHRHVIVTFKTYSQAPTHQSLIDTGGAYNNIRAPPSLRLSNLNIASRESDVKHLLPTRSL
jgi:hypothetical protein